MGGWKTRWIEGISINLVCDILKWLILAGVLVYPAVQFSAPFPLSSSPSSTPVAPPPAGPSPREQPELARSGVASAQALEALATSLQKTNDRLAGLDAALTELNKVKSRVDRLAENLQAVNDRLDSVTRRVEETLPSQVHPETPYSVQPPCRTKVCRVLSVP